MTTWIRFDTDTGVTVPASARGAILGSASPLNRTLVATDDDSWLEALPPNAVTDGAVEISSDGATTITSFTGDVSNRELKTLRDLLQHGRRGEVAVILEEDDGVYGSIQLIACNGDGAAHVHAGHTTFPTYGGTVPLPANADATPMAEASELWRAALPAPKTPDLRRGRGNRHLPPPTRSAFTLEPHDDGQTQPGSAPSPRL
ncbi:MAG: hypothetical protein K2X97_05735 [Mycobacteriaceae bacterium]|nr:hypothetical protein [Mycobacteriaceae bacterium]